MSTSLMYLDPSSSMPTDSGRFSYSLMHPFLLWVTFTVTPVSPIQMTIKKGCLWERFVVTLIPVHGPDHPYYPLHWPIPGHFILPNRQEMQYKAFLLQCLLEHGSLSIALELSWSISLNVADMSQRHVRCRVFCDVTQYVPTSCIDMLQNVDKLPYWCQVSCDIAS